MARLVHVEGNQVRAACAAFEKLLARNRTAQKERKEHERWIKAEKVRRDKEFAATQPKTRSTKQRAQK
jgi:hypothetical protein